MTIPQFVDKMKTIEKLFASYISCDDKIEENYQNIKNFLDEHKILDNESDFQLFLRFLNMFSNHHHRTPNYFDKIEKIIQLMLLHIVILIHAGYGHLHSQNQKL